MDFIYYYLVVVVLYQFGTACDPWPLCRNLSSSGVGVTRDMTKFQPISYGAQNLVTATFVQRNSYSSGRNNRNTMKWNNDNLSWETNTNIY